MSRIPDLLRRHTLLQLGVLFGCWAVGTAVVRGFAWHLPGSIVGLALLLALLAARWVHAASLRDGARWLLADMLLFFVPAVLSVLDHPEFLGLLGVKLLFVLLVSTALVMGVTASVVHVACRWGNRHGL
jgi:holin-like protein